MGFKPDLRIDVDKVPPSYVPMAHQRAGELQEHRKKLLPFLTEAKEAMKTFYDRKHIKFGFSVGDNVMLRKKNIRSARPSEKLDNRYEGPFTIIDAWGTQSYKLRLPPQMRRLYDVFHVSLLEPYRGDPARAPNPGPILLDGVEEYTIEQVLNQKHIRGTGLRYECK
jgi:hypothetical protein